MDVDAANSMREPAPTKAPRTRTDSEASSSGVLRGHKRVGEKAGATDLYRDSRAPGAENKEKDDAPSPLPQPYIHHYREPGLEKCLNWVRVWLEFAPETGPINPEIERAQPTSSCAASACSLLAFGV